MNPGQEDMAGARTQKTQTDLRWGGGASARDRLFADGSRFDFYQAVRILSLLERGGSDGRFQELPVRFRSSMSFDFPAGEIAEIVPPDAGGLPAMVVHFLGLAGAHGPLPVTYAEPMLRSQASGLRDFLDIFHHRLVVLLYRVHQMHHPVLTGGTPDESLAAQHLYSIFGLGRDEGSTLREQLSIPDRALLYYSALLAQHPHSAHGLERLLADYFGVAVAVEEFAGGWLDLAEDQWTRIGEVDGRNQHIGDGALLGRRVWDEHVGVRVKLGPLDLVTFERFLPKGPGDDPAKESAYGYLCDLTRFYLGAEVDFEFQLQLRVDQIPEVAASSEKLDGSPVRRAVLGRVAWLEQDRAASNVRTGHADNSVTIPGSC